MLSQVVVLASLRDVHGRRIVAQTTVEGKKRVCLMAGFQGLGFQGNPPHPLDIKYSPLSYILVKVLGVFYMRGVGAFSKVERDQ